MGTRSRSRVSTRLARAPGEDYVLRWELDAGAQVGRDDHGREVTLHPFLGMRGMPPAKPGIHATSPPRVWVGNIDCKELVAGTKLFLPIPVDGALFSAGEHGRQGGGESSGTASTVSTVVTRLPSRASSSTCA